MQNDSEQELQRKLEEMIHSQRCRMLALQSHLQCTLEAAQAALPTFRTELDLIRQLTNEWKQTATESLNELRSNVLEQTTLLLASIEADWMDRLEEERDRSSKRQSLKIYFHKLCFLRNDSFVGQVEKERERLTEELQSTRREVDEWKEKSLSWEQEKKELIASAQQVLQQREKELEQFREDQLQARHLEHRKEINALLEQAKAAEEEHKTVIGQWQSAADQVNF